MRQSEPIRPPAAPRPPRIALYSHDTQGLGHIRRNLLISHALCRRGPSPIVLLLSGLREASAFALPAGVDCLTLPSLGKGEDGEYYPRSLGVSMEELIDVRSRTIAAALRSFDPDVLIVDKIPKGIFDELQPSLDSLRDRGGTRIVLGLRDILDDAATVRAEWRAGRYDAAIRTYFDRIWVYGDRKVFDAAQEYGFSPAAREMVRYSGYLNPRHAAGGNGSLAAATETYDHQVLCLVGGGRDGLPLAEAFLRAEFDGRSLLVTGPLMSDEGRAQLRSIAAQRSDARVMEFVTDPCPLIAQADHVITMGGYNTTCEVLAYGKPALIVPRTTPRTEQLIRARRLAALGLVDVLEPERLEPKALAAWVREARPPDASPGSIIDFDGVERLPKLLDEVSPARDVGKEFVHAAV